ncbi:DUF6531 domain-containing protein [Photobacterium japonica]|uniref:RHS repeat-associated core domain-containing protein n=1 Tax=Photobacterium japonica TaxID=2910235 RepID=UPI003D09C7B7
MDGLLQLKANDGRAYRFTVAKQGRGKAVHFHTLQLARLHIDKFSRLRPIQGADLLAVLGLLDFSAEVRARSMGSRAFAQVKETLAQALFDQTLSVYEVPVAQPMVVHAPPKAPPAPRAKRTVTTQGGRDDSPAAGTGENSVTDSPVAASPDEMAYCGDPVSMATGEEILTLTDVVLTGSAAIHWQRTYRSSLSQQNVGLGYGWRSNFHGELTPVTDEDTGKIAWHFVDHQGDKLVFPAVAVGKISYHLTAGASLLHDAPSVYRLTLQNGRQLRFTQQQGRWVMDRIRESETLQYTLSYSSGGRLIGISANGGAQLEFRYDRGGCLTEVQSPSPNARDEQGRITHAVVLAHYHYTAEGDLCEASNRQQHVEKYRYDNHLLVQRTRPSGFRHYFEWQGRGARAKCIAQWGDEGHYHYRFTYEEANHVAISTDSLGNEWRFEHNRDGRLLAKVSPLGHRWAYRYDSRSRKVADITPNGGVTHFRYNAYGQLSEQEAPDGGITRYQYNRLGQVIQITDGENRVWRNDYNSFGRLLSQQLPGGLEKQYHYDRHGRVIHIEQSDGQDQRYWWGAQGQLTAQQQGEAITRYSYDALGEMNGIISPDGWVTQYERDRSGLIVKISEYPHDQADQCRHYSLSYDWAGRPITMTDPLGRTHRLAYEGLAQPTQHIRPDGSTLTFGYDKERNLTAITRSDGVTYSLQYDGEERVTQTVGFDGRTQQYQYDGQGNLISVAENGDRFVHLRRDACGRVLEQRCSVNGLTHANHFHYDTLGRIKHANNAQRKVSIQYHPNGQPSDVWQDNWCVKHECDHAGRRTSTVLPDQQRIEYRYDAQGRLIAMAWQQQPVFTRQFDSSGRETVRQWASGVTSQHVFDRQGRLQQQRLTSPAHPDHQRDYHYSVADQLVGIKDSTRGDSEYGFDVLDQLTQGAVPLPSGHAQAETLFAFDSFGNPLPRDGQNPRDHSEDDTAPWINVERDQLLQWHDAYFRYDAFGNQTKTLGPQGNEQRCFNGLNQLISLKKAGKYTQYHYDALGRRSAKISERQQIDYLWDGDQLIGEHCAGQFTWYLYEPGSFKPVALVANGQVYHYHLDHLGTPLTLTNSHGEIVWQADYSVQGVATPSIAHIPNPLRFQGQYWDEESGLHYNRFRYYDPQVGRFIHQDPIGLLGGINPYQYAPNPVQWVDPLGLSCKEEKEKTSGKSMQIGEFGSFEPIKGSATRGFFKTIVSDTTMEIIYGEISSVPFLRADPIDRADMEAYEAVAGLERYATLLTPTGAANFAKNAIIDGVKLVDSPEIMRELVKITKSVNKYRGGSHRDMIKPVGDGLDSHHMPAKQSNLSVHPNDGPAIQMDPFDHHLTSSNGRNGRAGAIYRSEITEMINSGDMRGAMAKEIRDVRRASLEGSSSRTKYNKAIKEMLGYAKSQGMLNKKGK